MLQESWLINHRRCSGPKFLMTSASSRTPLSLVYRNSIPYSPSSFPALLIVSWMTTCYYRTPTVISRYRTLFILSLTVCTIKVSVSTVSCPYTTSNLTLRPYLTYRNYSTFILMSLRIPYPYRNLKIPYPLHPFLDRLHHPGRVPFHLRVHEDHAQIGQAAMRKL